jgi:hypothetical protein
MCSSSSAGAWTEIAVAFEAKPPEGTYAILGAESFAASARPHRFVFNGHELAGVRRRRSRKK